MAMRDKGAFIPFVDARDETTDFLPPYSGMKAHFCGIHTAKAMMSGGVLVTVFLWSPPMLMVMRRMLHHNSLRGSQWCHPGHSLLQNILPPLSHLFLLSSPFLSRRFILEEGVL